MEILFSPFLLFIAFPAAAFVMAALFAVLGWRITSARKWLYAAAIAWSLYGVWESYIWFWAKGVTAPIRVDLLVLAPLLYFVSVFAIIKAIKAR